MRIREIDAFLESNATPPADPGCYRAWLAMPDARAFLVDSAEGDVPVYISRDRFFLYATFVPQRRLGKRYVADLLGWNFGPSAGWGYSVGWNPATDQEDAAIAPPLDHTGTRILEGAEPVVFLRDLFDSAESHYLELDQRFAHVSGVHRVEQKAAYCRVDEHGDLQPVVSLREEPSNILCTVARDVLDTYLYLTNSVLVRVFEVNRHRRRASPFTDDRRETHIDDAEHDLHARLVFLAEDGPEAGSYLRGFQVVRNARPAAELLRQLRGEPEQAREYATFLAIDVKHGGVRACSCDPEQLGNYFEPSDLPYETSPAFFRPEVMLKYKQDPDKYTIRPRSITCRAAWHLDYDVNDAGQVHAYLIDLARLPHSEQLYWNSFNEAPQTGLSEQAFRNDFLGEWFAADDPLEALKRRLLDFPRARQHGREVDIWAATEDAKARDFPRLAYVLTESAKEWEDQILELAKVLVEGLKKPPLRALAKTVGLDDATIGTLGTLTLLRKCLEGRGVEGEVADEVLKPLQELQGWRSSGGVAHAGSQRPAQNLRLHYRSLVERCDRAMETLSALIRTGTLDVM